jgi:hypothetical protein
MPEIAAVMEGNSLVGFFRCSRTEYQVHDRQTPVYIGKLDGLPPQLRRKSSRLRVDMGEGERIVLLTGEDGEFIQF